MYMCYCVNKKYGKFSLPVDVICDCDTTHGGFECDNVHGGESECLQLLHCLSHHRLTAWSGYLNSAQVHQLTCWIDTLMWGGKLTIILLFLHLLIYCNYHKYCLLC